MLEFDKKKMDSLASMAGPGKMPSRKSWIVGGSVLVLVLSG